MQHDERKDWKKLLDGETFRVTREKGTEVPFSGELLNNKEQGIYCCSNCKQELFSSDTKFDSGTGWPSFTDALNRRNVRLEIDSSLGTERVEVLCKNCGAHLGHVFDDGPSETGKRYCINSVALKFNKEDNKNVNNKN